MMDPNSPRKCARKRQIFEDARSTEIIMHQLTFSRPEVAELIAEEYLE